MTTWIKDTNGNRCSVEYFGSEEAAQKALDSLRDCRNCTNCSDCSDCSYCSGCSGCSGKKGENGDFVPPTIPVIENIHARVLEAVSQPDALDMGDWRTCNTTHCRAGWVVHLAGEAGYALERFHDTALAAQLIYRASAPDLTVSPTRFYDSNNDAMADMQRMAELEAAQARQQP